MLDRSPQRPERFKTAFGANLATFFDLLGHFELILATCFDLLGHFELILEQLRST